MEFKKIKRTPNSEELLQNLLPAEQDAVMLAAAKVKETGVETAFSDRAMQITYLAITRGIRNGIRNGCANAQQKLQAVREKKDQAEQARADTTEFDAQIERVRRRLNRRVADSQARAEKRKILAAEEDLTDAVIVTERDWEIHLVAPMVIPSLIHEDSEPFMEQRAADPEQPLLVLPAQTVLAESAPETVAPLPEESLAPEPEASQEPLPEESPVQQIPAALFYTSALLSEMWIEDVTPTQPPAESADAPATESPAESTEAPATESPAPEPQGTTEPKSSEAPETPAEPEQPQEPMAINETAPAAEPAADLPAEAAEPPAQAAESTVEPAVAADTAEEPKADPAEVNPAEPPLPRWRRSPKPPYRSQLELWRDYHRCLDAYPVRCQSPASQTLYDTFRHYGGREETADFIIECFTEDLKTMQKPYPTFHQWFRLHRYEMTEEIRQNAIKQLVAMSKRNLEYEQRYHPSVPVTPENM
ncbi:MAG: hypothetical protein LBR73_02925 [Oscillospiraceae bacterium]|jgi:hypothetical protein|nr:hypothetical protein [Oscillospiraceae bacterium]